MLSITNFVTFNFGRGIISQEIGLGIFITTSDINSPYKVVSMQYREIYQAKENGQSTIILKRYPKPKTLFNAYNGTNNLGESRDAWFNRWMAVYFGIDSIQSRE